MIDKTIIDAINKVQDEAWSHTDLVFAFNRDGIHVSQGSGIIISYKGQIYLLTAKHVVIEANHIFSGAFAKEDTNRSTLNNKVKNLKMVYEDETWDFSIFGDYPLGNNPAKQAYEMELSKNLSCEIMKKNTGTLSCSIGYLGILNQILDLSEEHIDTNAQLFHASGPIVDVTEDKIIVDMTAREYQFYTQEAKDLETSLTNNYGCFPFKGCSGCGLWVIDESTIKLIGIMSCGAISGNADPKTVTHMVEFVPIWKVIAKLNMLTQS